MPARKSKMTTAVDDFCATDMRVFEAVDGKGIKDLFQTALDIGVASTGRIELNDLPVASSSAICIQTPSQCGSMSSRAHSRPVDGPSQGDVVHAYHGALHRR